MKSYPTSHRELCLCILIALQCGSGAMASGDQAFLDLLEAKCAECHGPGDEEPELHKGVSLVELRSSKYVIAGEPDRSELLDRVLLPTDDKERMPRSKGSAGGEKFREPLTTAEAGIIREWIAGGGAAAQPAAARTDSITQTANRSARPFIREEEIYRLVFDDLSNGGVQDRRAWRYVTLHNYWNQKDVTESDLEVFAQAISKLVNSLSLQKKIVRPKALGEQGMVFRIDARDYGFDLGLWATLQRHYPFGIERGLAIEADIVKLANPIQAIAKSVTAGEEFIEWPVMRADWWAYMLAQPPFYYDVLKFPGSSGNAIVRSTAKSRLAVDRAIETDLKILQPGDDVRAGRVHRMGFEVSAVSQGNRVVERHALSDGGYYWKSYDFNRDRKQIGTTLKAADIFLAPLGPPEYGLTGKPMFCFRQDGGEILYSLPNGLQAYLLVDGQGKRLDKGPFEVVQDSKHPRGTIINGVSCMACHSTGIQSLARGKKDEVAAMAEGLGLAEGERQLVDSLYGRQSDLDELMKLDTQRFLAALKECGVTTETDPVGRLYFKFLTEPVRAENLAAEFSAPIEDIVGKLKRSSVREVRNNVSRPSVDRQVFMSLFATAAVDLGLGKPRPFTPVAVAETQGAFTGNQAAGLQENPLLPGASGWRKTGTVTPPGQRPGSQPEIMKMRRSPAKE